MLCIGSPMFFLHWPGGSTILYAGLISSYWNWSIVDKVNRTSWLAVYSDGSVNIFIFPIRQVTLLYFSMPHPPHSHRLQHRSPLHVQATAGAKPVASIVQQMDGELRVLHPLIYI